jgi:hypothetical protein
MSVRTEVAKIGAEQGWRIWRGNGVKASRVMKKIGRGGFKESVDGNVTGLPRIKESTVFGGKYDGKPLPSNFRASFYYQGPDPKAGSGMNGGQVKKMGFGPETIPPRGVKIGAGFF